MFSIFNNLIDQTIERNDNVCKIVSIEGIDGSGKTTVVNNVVSKLQEKGYRATHFVTASDYNVFWNVVETMQKQGIVDDYVNQTLHNLVLITYLKTEFINLLNNNDFLVSEWYIYGKLLLSELYDSDAKSKKIIESYIDNNELIFPDYSFFLEVTPEEAYRRINLRNERRESKESLLMLRKALTLWQKYIEEYNIERINGMESSEQVTSNVLRRILR